MVFIQQALNKDILILKLVIGNISVHIVLITLILDLHRNQHMYIKLHSPSYEPYSDHNHLISRDHPFSTVSEMIPCDHLIIQTHFATFDLVKNDCVVTKIRTWIAGQQGHCRSGFDSVHMKGPLYSYYGFFCQAFLLNDKKLWQLSY